MSESLPLLSSGGVGGGFICLVLSVKLSTKLSFPSVFFVVPSSNNSRLVSTSSVDFQLQLFVHIFGCSVSSKVVFGRGGAPSCVGKSKRILRLEGTA